MKAKSRTEEELIQELEVLRRRVASMEESRGKGAPEEEARRDGEERYRLFFEESRDAMSISSSDGKVVEVNQATLDIFGYTREEAMRLPVLEAYAHPEDRPRFQQELQKKGFARDYEVALRKKGGTEMECLVSATVRRAKDGSILGYHAIIRDITERKRAEEALRESETMLRQSEKMAVLGTLTAGVAHELNNPAAAAKSGAAQLETAIAQLEQAQSQLRRLDLTAAQQRELKRLTQEALRRAARPPELNALARSDREGTIET